LEHLLSSNTALLIIDVQQGFDDPKWGLRNNLKVARNKEYSPSAPINIEFTNSCNRQSLLQLAFINLDAVKPR